MMIPAVAVLDIGKTNKKVALYDDEMRPLAVRRRRIDTISRDGLDIEDVETAEGWFLDQLRELSAEYAVRGIAISAHGASLVCIDSDGTLSVPPAAYTNEVEEGVHEGFWAAMGDPRDVQRRTATAEVKPLINPGKLLWYLKESRPEEFQRTRHILFYPQYFGYRLTGRIAADITYAGCHGYLWDFGRSDWSEVVDKLGVRGMLPGRPGLPADELGPISPRIAEITGLSPDTRVTLGIHDSNSSLIPYLITQDRDFVLNSTGTWCVAMHPVEDVRFEDDELGKMVFYNLSYEGKPIKTSILMGGLEYAFYTEMLMARHKRGYVPGYNPGVYSTILARPRTFILPSVVPGSGQFPDSPARVLDDGVWYSAADIADGRRWPEAFENYRAGFALVNLSVAIQTTAALRRVGLVPGTEVFIEGGFRSNGSYAALLGALMPDNPLFLTSLDEAACFGAALTARAMVDGVSVASLKRYVRLEKKPVRKARLPGLQEYVRRFMEALQYGDAGKNIDKALH